MKLWWKFCIGIDEEEELEESLIEFIEGEEEDKFVNFIFFIREFI